MLLLFYSQLFAKPLLNFDSYLKDLIKRPCAYKKFGGRTSYTIVLTI